MATTGDRLFAAGSANGGGSGEQPSDWRARYNRHVIAVRTPLAFGAGAALAAYAVIRTVTG